jgi:SM-20-related protein
MNLHFEPIAQGLADNGYAIADGFLSSQEVEGILGIDEFNGDLLQLTKAGVGSRQEKKINEGIRGDYVKWIDRNKAPGSVRVYLSRLDELMTYLNTNLYLSLKDVELHFAVYPVGTSYQRHLDQFRRFDHRRLSVILYLNKEWEQEEGGQLRMHLAEGAIDVLPQAGRLVCFRSDQLEHEVLTASRIRLSITGWMLDRPPELIHL